MKTIVVAAFACMLAEGTTLAAQAPGRAGGPPQAAAVGEIRGTVLDAEGKTPIATASVAVWTKDNATLVAGALTQQNGTFRIEGLMPNAYTLKIAMIGYDPHTVADVVITPASPRAATGNIALARSPIALQSVEVNAQRAMVIAPDRNAYRARDIAPAAASATEVLEATPSVHVDSDGKVSLRGNENVVVQINGRPTPIRGAQLASYLKQLPANTIDRIEVVPNPSAKYDPEGMAGILNIVMKQNVDLGRSSGLTLSASNTDQYSAAGNFGYQSGPVSLLLSYGFNSSEQLLTASNDRTRLGALRAPLAYTEQDIGGQTANRGHNLNATLDYRLSPHNVLYTALLANRRTSSDETMTAYNELNGNRVPMAQYDRSRDQENRNWLVDATIGLRRTITSQKNELIGELRFSKQADDEDNALARLLNPSANPLELQSDALDAVTYQATAQTDYTRTLGQSTKLETGYKGTARWLDRNFLVQKVALGNGDWVRSDLSNALEFDERVNAGYAVLSQKRGKLEMQAGLRLEYATRDFSLDGESYPHSYGSLFPSGVVSYTVSDKSQARLSYSRRIRRPSTQELNPFPAFFDVNNVFLGNPRLDPEYTDAIELGLQRSGKLGSLQFAPFYRRTTDVIRVDINTADTIANREVTTVSFRNLDTGSSWGADLNGQLRAGKFGALGGVNVFKMVTDGGSESSLSSDAVTWMARINGTYNLTPATTLQGSYFYRAPMNIERGRFDSFSGANFSVRQKLAERAFATLRVNDPFKTNRFKVEVGDDNIIQLTRRSFNTRAVFLSFQYSVGQAPRIRQRQEEQQQGSTPFVR
ncbi:MAG: TonB-dependent receptor domain-containing protein [Longimicrobiales bacterium]